MSKAREFHRQAMAELEAWGVSRINDVLIRDAAEKAWGAVTHAASELVEALDKTGRVPRGTESRRHALAALEKRYRELRGQYLSDRFASAESVLHIHCFYDGEYRPSEVEEWIRERSREFLDSVEEAVAHPPRR